MIEVVERNKEGYESDIDEDDDDFEVEALSDALETFESSRYLLGSFSNQPKLMSGLIAERYFI